MPPSDPDTATRLVEWQVHRAIAECRFNLAAVARASAEGWIPSGDEPGVAAHLETLRNHLRDEGEPEDDPFLLRYALTVPGTQRGIVPPLVVLDPIRNGFSERRKREAAGPVTRLRAALDLGRVVLPGLSPETASALAELDAIANRPPEPGDPSTLDRFRHLSADQASAVAWSAVRFLEDRGFAVRSVGFALLRNLACFRFEPLGPEIQQTLREKDIFWPAVFSRDGGDAEAEELLRRIDRGHDEHHLPALVHSLAWTRGRLAETRFRDWIANPPRWISHWPAPLGQLPPLAGWTLNAGGERVDLIALRCHRLRPADAESPGSIACCVPLPDPCPCCLSPLAVLFDFGNVASILPPGAPRRVVCCLSCSGDEPTFVRHHDDDSWAWVAPTTASASAIESEVTPQTRHVVCEATECPPFASENMFEIDDASAIGGIPMWFSNPEYPRCPSCGERMTFLAQHDNRALAAEGIYYAHFCPGCQVSAVNYQQM